MSDSNPSRSGRTPGGRGLSAAVRDRVRRLLFPGSREYWERRYRRGEDSGAGSYGPMGDFKVEAVTDVLHRHAVRDVIEFGCGDGEIAGRVPYSSYVGLDVSPKAVELCTRRYSGDDRRRFFLLTDSYPADLPIAPRADLALSLDVIYHLVEDPVFEAYMERLFRAAERLVLIYSSNFDRCEPAAHHVRHRQFTQWVDRERSDFRLIEEIPNRYPVEALPGGGSLAEFYLFERTPDSRGTDAG